MREIILASKSPRRKTLLEEKGYKVIVDVSHADESLVKEKDISKKVMAISKSKADIVIKRHPNAIVVAADTMVYFNGEDIGQQHNDKDAENTIRKLLGKIHEVYTGITVVNTKTGKVFQDFELSKVALKNVSEDTLAAYIKSGKYKGKAGAYCITDPEFESFVDWVEGSFDNILGLPLKKVDHMIHSASE
jgi:septum formation protein